jgi:AcrR family transcriptional regulator
MIADIKSDFPDVPETGSSRPAPPVKMGARALAKQRTRERVIAAARRLFTELGYEGATIRQIAQAAGMSTGAVFASFPDKDALFEEIILADDAKRLQSMRDAIEGAKTVEDALLAGFEISYGFHLQHLPLLRARIACSWTRTPETEFRMRELRAPITSLVDLALAGGVKRGELSSKADLKLIGQTINDLVVANYRLAIFDGWDKARLLVRLHDQIKLILAGVRA